MSKTDLARTSADATLEQGKSTIVTVSSRVRALPAHTRNLTRSAATAARQQTYATVGATDAVVASVIRQREQLPIRTTKNAAKLAETTKDRVKVATELTIRAQEKVASAAGALTERTVDVAASVRKITPAATATRVKDAADGQRAKAKDAHAKLAVRGQQVATDLRHDPVLVRLIGGVDARVGNAANAVTSVAQKVRARASAQSRREAAATTSTPVRATPSNKVPAHRTTVRKTPAAEAAVSTTPTHRAAAHETATRATAARQAAAVRKAAVEEAAATRKAAARKAAATRKATAVEAAAKREAAAEKAAETRKKNAAASDAAAQTRHAAAVKAAATRKSNAAHN